MHRIVSLLCVVLASSAAAETKPGLWFPGPTTNLFHAPPHFPAPTISRVVRRSSPARDVRLPHGEKALSAWLENDGLYTTAFSLLGDAFCRGDDAVLTEVQRATLGVVTPTVGAPLALTLAACSTGTTERQAPVCSKARQLLAAAKPTAEDAWTLILSSTLADCRRGEDLALLSRFRSQSSFVARYFRAADVQKRLAGPFISELPALYARLATHGEAPVEALILIAGALVDSATTASDLETIGQLSAGLPPGAGKDALEFCSGHGERASRDALARQYASALGRLELRSCRRGAVDIERFREPPPAYLPDWERKAKERQGWSFAELEKCATTELENRNETLCLRDLFRRDWAEGHRFVSSYFKTEPLFGGFRAFDDSALIVLGHAFDKREDAVAVLKRLSLLPDDAQPVGESPLAWLRGTGRASFQQVGAYPINLARVLREQAGPTLERALVWWASPHLAASLDGQLFKVALRNDRDRSAVIALMNRLLETQKKTERFVELRGDLLEATYALLPLATVEQAEALNLLARPERDPAVVPTTLRNLFSTEVALQNLVRTAAPK